MGETPQPIDWNEAVKSLKGLLKAGLDLGVPEAVRKASQFAPILQSEDESPPETVGEAVQNVLNNIKQDPAAMLQLAKEVWSRGGSKEKEKAASAVGRGLGALVPHRALQAAKELAGMARNGREADLVGREAIEPILDAAPALFDRVKQLLQENQKLIRMAAIQGLVAYVGRKRKFVALGAELLLIIAEEHEKEIRDAVKWGIQRLMEIDPKATAKAVGDWVTAKPTKERVQASATYLKQKAGTAARAVGAGVASTVAKLRSSNGNGAAKKPTKGKPASKKAAKTRKPAAVKR